MAPRVKKPKLTKRDLHLALPILDCVTLNIDAGTPCGWSIFLRGEWMASGECDVYSDDVESVVRTALGLGHQQKLPVVLVIEKPYAGNLATAAGMGAKRGTWITAWVRQGGVKSRKLLVLPSVWRCRVLPKGIGKKLREEIQADEQEYALQVTGRVCGVDESPAIGIGFWSARAPEVLKKLPKGRKPKVDAAFHVQHAQSSKEAA